MKIILIDKIEKLGNLGDIIKVKCGYARNYLIPKNKAIQATKNNIELFKAYNKELELKNKILKENAINRAKKINDLHEVTIFVKSGNYGKIFGSIGAKRIAEEISSKGINIDKSEIRMPQKSLRSIGRYNIKIYLHNNVSVDFLVKVVTEK